jgi:hypothetical protein
MSAKIPDSAADFVRLLFRAGPFALSVPEIGTAPAPRFDAGLPFPPASTLGGLVRLWENLPATCPSCGETSALTGFQGNPLSGTGKKAFWFCPRCVAPFETIPAEPLARFWDRVAEARETPCLVVPPEGGAAARSGSPFGSADRTADALEALAALDREAASALAAGRPFLAVFGLRTRHAEGTVSFGDVPGQALVRGPFSGPRFVPASYDPVSGLWPTLFEAASALDTRHHSFLRNPDLL